MKSSAQELLEQKLELLISNAKENDILIKKIHGLAIELIRAETASSIYRSFKSVMRKQIRVDFADILLCGFNELAFSHVDDSDIKSLENDIYSGHQNTELAIKVFGDQMSGLKSFCRLLLRTRRGRAFGVIYFGSKDIKHYSHDMADDFLRLIQEMISCAFERVLKIK